MDDPIVFVRKMPMAVDTLRWTPMLGHAIGELMRLMESDIEQRAEGRKSAVLRMDLIITEHGGSFHPMAEAEARLTVLFAT